MLDAKKITDAEYLAFHGLMKDAKALLENNFDIHNDIHAKRCYAVTLTIEGEYQQAVKLFYEILDVLPFDRVSLGYIAVCYFQLGENSKSNEIINFDHILLESLPLDKRDILAIEKHILTHETLQWAKEDKATQVGYQTDFILDDNETSIIKLKKAIVTYIEANLNISMEEAGLFIEGWAVVMEKGGHQLPHMHEASLLTGVFYINVPETSQDAGNLRFRRSLPWTSLNGSKMCGEYNEFKSIKPANGYLVLFPSHFWHDTIPLNDSQRRISIAFDILKEKEE